MSTTFTPMHTLLDPAEGGEAKLTHYTTTQLDALRSIMSRGPVNMSVDPGDTLTLLRVGGELVMSDSDMEKRTNYEVVRRARGRVLIAGLGLGMVLLPIVKKPEVLTVTVIEKSLDVINTVWSQLEAKVPEMQKVMVLCHDIFDWRPPKGAKYDTIYFDIWPTICIDDLEDRARLHQAFKSYKAPGGWMGSWAHEELRCWRRRGGY